MSHRKNSESSSVDIRIVQSGHLYSNSGIAIGGVSGNSWSNGGNPWNSGSQSNGSNNANSSYTSNVELEILRSNDPIEVNETAEITVMGQRGIWLNRGESNSWSGQIPLNEYQINEDSNPEVINKSSKKSIEYLQELAIKYLRPPTPPAPGEIVIVQQGNQVSQPAPPLIIRQQPARPVTPQPLVIREAPPRPPQSVGRKVITIGGRRLPPPPRKVIIERLASLPVKPQSILIERWLPYKQVKRRVIFQKGPADAVVVKPRNVIVQWSAPRVNIRKEIKILGVVKANPADYVRQYGSSLKSARELPQFVLDIKAPNGIVLAADSRQNSVYELEGDLQGFQFVDLDREGLSEYRAQLERLGIRFDGGSSGSSSSNGWNQNSSSSSSANWYDWSGNGWNQSGSSGKGWNQSGSSGSSRGGVSAKIEKAFNKLDADRNGSLSIAEARRAFLWLNSGFNRSYGEDEVQDFFRALDFDRNGSVSIDEFKAAYMRLVSQQ